MKEVGVKKHQAGLVLAWFRISSFVMVVLY